MIIPEDIGSPIKPGTLAKSGITSKSGSTAKSRTTEIPGTTAIPGITAKYGTTGKSEAQKYFAVFGNPVLHSKSPQIYNSLFTTDGVNAFYTRIHTSAGRDVCELIRELGLSGANITTPFKEDVLPCLDRLSPGAEMISAVNTIINDGGNLTGYNTDADGVTGALLEAGIDPSGRRCMVMGTGGAGKAAVVGLQRMGADVTIANRSEAKAYEFAAKAGCRHASLEAAAGLLKNYDVLVITLPPGVYPFKTEQLHRGLVIVDANYRSSAGLTRKDSAQQVLEQYPDPVMPCRVIKGDRWLLHQAVEAYRLFTGKKADIDVMDSGMKAGIDKRNLVTRIIKDRSPGILSGENIHMLVDGRGLNDRKIKMIIDEERSKAFGNKG